MDKKHKTIKFEYEISSQKIPFLGTVLYKDKENNPKTTLYRIEKRKGKSKACNAIRSALCCMQVVNTNSFKSNQTKSFQHKSYH